MLACVYEQTSMGSIAGIFLINSLSFMPYLFGTKSIKSLQLCFWTEGAIYIVLLCESWTKRSMLGNQAWCWAKDTGRVFAGHSWPRGQSFLPDLQCLLTAG